MKRFLILTAFVALFGSISCSKTPVEGLDDTQEETVPEVTEQKADGKLQLSPKSSEMAAMGNSFAFIFLDKVNAAKEGSFVISPLSMQFLLGMILNGAKGDTAAEICNVLGYGAGEIEAVNEFSLSMLKQLPKLDELTKLTIANAVAVNQRYQVKDSFKSSLSKSYEAEIFNLDFGDSQGTSKTINKWCADHTEGLIPEVLTADNVMPEMFAFLMNALYFKSPWCYKFKPEDTEPEQFTDSNGNVSTVQMMKMNKELPFYCKNEIFSSVCLPYGNGTYKMYLFLPEEGMDLSGVIKSLGTKGLESLHYSRARVDLWLPRFETESKIDMNDLLIAMGMPTAFSNSANLEGMSDVYGTLKLDFIKQMATITVDEEGSEAAAVSVGGFLISSLPPSVSFHANRPFLYLITEASTSAVLFAGKYSGE